MKKRMLITGLLIGILCLPVIAQTTPVPILNPSFEVETAPIADGEWSYSIPGWLNVGQTTWDPRSSAYPSGVPDGDNVAAIWTGFWIKQVLGHILMPDTELTLNVDIGWRNGYSAPDYEIQLLVGNNIFARSNSFSPRASSSARIWPLMVGWVSDRLSAARTTLPSRATVQK